VPDRNPGGLDVSRTEPAIASMARVESAPGMCGRRQLDEVDLAGTVARRARGRSR
jgi:hypothetical protein